MEVILFQPQIPQNTGNIARTCAVTNTKLTLVRPLGFSTHSRHLKRSGLDYWDWVSVHLIDELETYLSPPFYFFSTKGKKSYTEIPFESSSQLIFGSETAGLPPHIHEKWGDYMYTIPMRSDVRSLNLSNAVAIVLYEALRQRNFKFD